MKKSIKKIIAFSLLIIYFLGATPVYAKPNTLAQLRKDLKSLEAQKRKNDAAKKMTNQQISSSKNTIGKSYNEIEVNKDRVEVAKEKVRVSKENIVKQKNQMNEVIYAQQLSSGSNEYMEYIFDAENLTDLIYRFAVSEQILEWQKEEIKKFENLVQVNEQLQVDLVKREVQLNNQINSLEKKLVSLGNQLAEISEISVDIEDDIKSAKEYIKFVEKAGCEENQDIDYCLRVVTDTGFRYPLKSGRITSNFGYRKCPITGKTKFHSGVDLGGNSEGTNVYASAAGVVGKVIKQARCGGNSVYLWHNVKGKKYTTSYTHLKEIKVKIGDIVTSETVVGTVGGGASTKWYDKCTTGPHLHFTMATGHYGGSGNDSYTAYSTYLVRVFDPVKYLGIKSPFSGR